MYLHSFTALQACYYHLFSAWKVFKYKVFFWSVFSCIQSEYRKTWTKKNSVFGRFSRSVSEVLSPFLIRNDATTSFYFWFQLLFWQYLSANVIVESCWRIYQEHFTLTGRELLIVKLQGHFFDLNVLQLLNKKKNWK